MVHNLLLAPREVKFKKNENRHTVLREQILTPRTQGGVGESVAFAWN